MAVTSYVKLNVGGNTFLVTVRKWLSRRKRRQTGAAGTEEEMRAQLRGEECLIVTV